MIVIRCDTKQLFAKLHKMERYASQKAIIHSAEILTRDIRSKTKAGKQADNTPFPSWYPTEFETDEIESLGTSVYSPSQTRKRKREGVTTARKNLNVTGGMLASLGLDGNWVTVGEQYQRIAHGQMFHPRWRYHHEFLLAGSDTVQKISDTNARNIIR